MASNKSILRVLRGRSPRSGSGLIGWEEEWVHMRVLPQRSENWHKALEKFGVMVVLRLHKIYILGGGKGGGRVVETGQIQCQHVSKHRLIL